jgi:hypothetical protein
MAVLDDEAFGAATDVVPKFVSPADPAARWTELSEFLCVRRLSVMRARSAL